jgi:uncharacterized ParB-like nuclease family protein
MLKLTDPLLTRAESKAISVFRLSPIDKLGLHVGSQPFYAPFCAHRVSLLQSHGFLPVSAWWKLNLLNLTPQGEVRLMGAFPGLKTPGLNPAAPSGRRALARSKP